MNRPGFSFEILHIDRHCGARLGRLTTPHGVIDLPAFMPVGTCGTVKGLTFDQVAATGSQIILGNTYHLALRPGSDLIASMGGLHSFIGWNGPILTDSGGFQLFSLAQLTQIDERGAVFRSHIDGTRLELTPERAVHIQQELGADIAMVLDHVVPLPSSPSAIEDACHRSIRWAARCRAAHHLESQVQFAIIQGGLDLGLRTYCAGELAAMDFFGYAIGGLSVGETAAEMYRTVAATCRAMPADKPRYLMGVGRPEDLLEGIRCGVDMFDCVMPTRNGRNACAFTDQGELKIRNAIHRNDPRPLQPDMETPYSHLSRAYLRHLFMSDEMLGPILLSFHNLAYYQRLMRDARQAIAADCFLEFQQRRMAGWRQNTATVEDSCATGNARD